MSEKNYLSEEELARLIEETEQSGMLKAPSYLKREILEQAAHTVVPMTPEQKKKSYRLYRMKVWGVAAAAIFALFLIPAGGNLPQKAQDADRGPSFMTDIHKQTNEWCSQIFEASNAFLAPTGSMKR